ncbi:MAG: nucleotide exchange factor GrpE [Thermodesulfovibrionales bacterium]|nr:nucleotide exchange factor GrpE [Thermodesulfovibrionales bacterium]
MRHKAKKKIEENIAEDNSHPPQAEEFPAPEASALWLHASGSTKGDHSGQEEAERCIAAETPESAAPEAGKIERNLEEELGQEKDRYLRLYAEFDNYKKRIARDREELIKYGNESLLYELLPVIDNLEMAMKHSSNDTAAGLAQGVEITLKEFLRVIDKFGLSPIDASDKMFDPSLHHAMTQIERDDIDENMVVEEFRKGYMFREKVLRPSLVAVSKKPAESNQLSAVSEERENKEEKIEEEK